MSRPRPAPAVVDDRLALMDQGSLLGLRALGHQPLFQATWTHRRPVDLDALDRFNQGLCATLLGRLVERSPLPGGRHRWVAVEQPPPIEVEPGTRRRAEVFAWTEEVGGRPLDPERGPGWRIGVTALADGGAAVTMVVPHTLGDGLCVLEAISDAVDGRERRPAYPRPDERSRARVLGEDLRGLVTGLPDVGRALRAGVRTARAQPAASPATVAPDPGPSARPPGPAGAAWSAPAACVRVAQTDWDRAAARRGGTSTSLAMAVAARLGQRQGRVDGAGEVTLAVPVSIRLAGDTRANALDSVTLRVDPEGALASLAPVRAATRAALADRAARPQDLLAMLPLVPLTPRWAARRLEAMAMGAAARPVGCSSYGPMPEAVARIDGGPADDMWVRLTEPGASPADLDRIGGQLYVLTGRVAGAVFVSVVAHRPGGGLDRARLLDEVLTVLAELDLTPSAITP